MSGRRVPLDACDSRAMTEPTGNLLTDAIARNSGLVLSLPSVGDLRHYKSRFLGAEDQVFLVQSVPGELPLIQSLIAAGKPCGIAFKDGPRRAICAARAMEIRPDYRINAETTAPALALAYPGEIKSLQRRTHYRVPVGAECDVHLRVWRMPPRASLYESPTPSAELGVRLRDISIGGVGVCLTARDGSAPLVCEEDRLRILLTMENLEVVIEGRMRTPKGPQPVPAIATGIIFKETLNDIESRRAMAAITRIVGDLQRQELRRARLGMMTAAETATAPAMATASSPAGQ